MNTNPQQDQIDVLVELAKTLTSYEADRMNESVISREAERAAWKVITVSGGHASLWDAVWCDVWLDKALRHVRGPVSDAVLALLVRHLIGATFTQAHYDSLTGPWVAEIGPAHPDDVVQVVA